MVQVESGDFSLLELLHHYTSGFKAFFTDMAFKGLDNLRQACGGAGFSAYSGLPNLVFEYSPQPTFEGENTVMA